MTQPNTYILVPSPAVPFTWEDNTIAVDMGEHSTVSILVWSL
jgi:hypothetical protein